MKILTSLTRETQHGCMTNWLKRNQFSPDLTSKCRQKAFVSRNLWFKFPHLEAWTCFPAPQTVTTHNLKHIIKTMNKPTISKLPTTDVPCLVLSSLHIINRFWIENLDLYLNLVPNNWWLHGCFFPPLRCFMLKFQDKYSNTWKKRTVSKK